MQIHDDGEYFDDDDDDDDGDHDHDHCVKVDGGWSVATVSSVGFAPG